MSSSAPNSGASAQRAQDVGTSRKGSVRAARERLNAIERNQAQGILPTAKSQAGPPIRSNELVSQFSVRVPKNKQTAENGDRSTQYSLDENDEDEYNQNVNTAPVHGARGPPPQRPPRPSYVPSILDPTRDMAELPGSTPHQYAVQRPENTLDPNRNTEDDDFLSPSFTSPRPLTTSSQDTTSTLGEIPDFPQPNPAQPPPRQRGLGPPPSARRGPSSYWSQQSFVSPIVEESEGTRSRNSFASSNLMPEFYLEDGERSPSFAHNDSGRSSRAADHDDQSGLVRQASLGRRTKPSLTTIKSVDTLREENLSRGASRKSSRGSFIGQAAVAIGATGGAFAAGLGSGSGKHSPHSNLSGGTGLIDASSDSEAGDSPRATTAMGGLHSPITRSRSPLAASGLAPGTSDPFDDNSFSRSGSKLSERAGSKRPPRLDIEAVREAEVRGSMTSLPDLIRRATRLAANLDRGKTASRLEFGFPGQDPFAQDAKDHQRKGSLSDMLASFPPPGLSTPDQASFNRRMSKWPSGHPYATSTRNGSRNEKQSEKRGRRCCGMPLWAFIVSMVILFLLIAAAIVVPIVLIVLPRQRNAAQSDESASRCATEMQCLNGGVPYQASAGCACICRNGFTGTNCDIASQQSCSSYSIPGSEAATIGNALPRLLNGAQSNYSIALNPSTIITLLTSDNFSCSTQNSLVQFGGKSQRDLDTLLAPRLVGNQQEPAKVQPVALATTIAAVLPRQDDSASSTTSIQIPSSLLIASSATTAAAAPTNAAFSINGQAALSDQRIADFARVAVLIVLQESRSTAWASEAQSSLAEFFQGPSNSPADSRNLTLNNGFSVNLNTLKIGLQNGTVVPQ